MEYVTGGDLFDYINRNGRIRTFRLSKLAVTGLSSLSDDHLAASLTTQMCEAMAVSSPEQAPSLSHSGPVSIFIAKESHTVI